MHIRAASLSLLLVVTGFSCARGHEPPPAVAPVASVPKQEPTPSIGLVDATIMFTDCAVVSNTNAKHAERAMHQLVEACSEVPGGTTQFTATLLPNGRIELASADGGLGTVPICVLHHELKHKVVVKKPCIMQVQMSERKPSTG